MSFQAKSSDALEPSLKGIENLNYLCSEHAKALTNSQEKISFTMVFKIRYHLKRKQRNSLGKVLKSAYHHLGFLNPSEKDLSDSKIYLDDYLDHENIAMNTHQLARVLVKLNEQGLLGFVLKYRKSPSSYKNDFKYVPASISSLESLSVYLTKNKGSLDDLLSAGSNIEDKARIYLLKQGYFAPKCDTRAFPKSTYKKYDDNQPHSKLKTKDSAALGAGAFLEGLAAAAFAS